MVQFLPPVVPELDDHLFDTIAVDIYERGYSIQKHALPSSLLELLKHHITSLPESAFKRAGIGRVNNLTVNDNVRTDEICWIDEQSIAGHAWLSWASELQRYLNRHLFMGLFSFESHFAHYEEGAFYKKHQDAFIGEANRILSLVVYLNDNWLPDQGGELLLYTGETNQDVITILPTMGTVVAFLSEEFPHEVLSACRDRYSIAGWFRVNNLSNGRIDPPL